MGKFIFISLSSAVMAFFVGVGWSHLGPSIRGAFLGKKTLKILCDEKWLEQALLEDYAQSAGIKLQYFSYARPSEFVRQIANGGSGFDMICFHSGVSKSLRESGVLKKMNPRDLTNLEQISVDFHNLPFDPSFEYSIPFAWDVFGFLAKTDSKEMSWSQRWANAAKNIELWPSELDVYSKLMTSVFQDIEWTDENQTQRLANHLKTFTGTMGGWVKPDELGKSIQAGLSKERFIQVPSGRAATFLTNNRELKYWIPEDGVSVAVFLLGQGAESQNSAEGLELINWLIDGAQAVRIQKFTGSSVVQAALNSSDTLESLQKASLMREIPSVRLRFTDIPLDAIPRFEKLFREVLLETNRP